MANAGSDRFCGSLFASVGGRVAADTKLLYRAKLAKWYLSDDQWARALSRIVGDLKSTDRGDVILPPLADIYTYLKAAQAEDRPAAGTHWLTFDVGVYRYAMRIKDPAHPPEPPRTATNVHLVIDEGLEEQREEPEVHRGKCERISSVAEIIEERFTFGEVK
jgi:hypothetical protein